MFFISTLCLSAASADPQVCSSVQTLAQQVYEKAHETSARVQNSCIPDSAVVHQLAYIEQSLKAILQNDTIAQHDAQWCADMTEELLHEYAILSQLSRYSTEELCALEVGGWYTIQPHLSFSEQCSWYIRHALQSALHHPHTPAATLLTLAGGYLVLFAPYQTHRACCIIAATLGTCSVLCGALHLRSIMLS